MRAQMPPPAAPDSEMAEIPISSDSPREVPPEEAEEGPSKVLGLPPKQALCLSFVFVLISLLFMIGATVAQDWSTYGDGDKKHTYGLLRCGDCPEGVAGTNWYCPMAIECEDNSDSGLCSLAKDMYNSGNAYMVGQLPTFFIAIMLLERLAYAAYQKDYGWPIVFYFLCGFYPICQIVTIILWFASHEAGFDNDCDVNNSDPNEDIEICDSNGPIVSIVATILSIFAGIISALVFRKRPIVNPDPEKTKVGRYSCFGVKNWLVMIGVMLFMLLVISLYVASPAHEEWIVTDGHTGGLLKLNGWGPYTNVGYDCISEPRCAIDSSWGSCWTFRTLHQGSMVFLFFEVGAIYCWLLWWEAACHYVIGRDYGFPLLNILSPIGSVLLHTVGTVVWLTRTQAKFETDCPYRPEHAGQRWDVCGKTGPILAIINIGIGLFTVVFYLGVYLARHQHVGDRKALASDKGIELAKA